MKAGDRVTVTSDIDRHGAMGYVHEISEDGQRMAVFLDDHAILETHKWVFVAAIPVQVLDVDSYEIGCGFDVRIYITVNEAN
jgi:hypothetical protein